MARYSLVMKDKVYVELLKAAERRGISVGKLINQILEQFVAKETGREFENEDLGRVVEVIEGEEVTA
ncbi:MAG TPA: hypothetical protein ENG51_13570 [Deltaproteobacteria bacterium]|nr:hypothetical protein [Deltaproteobacteria bacterium]